MNSQVEGDYLLGTDYEELRRLQMQHWTWQPETVDLWDHAGFGKGQTILDVGCGPGLTTLELAERVGPEGRVVGIDGSEEFTDILRRKAEGIGHIEVVPTDVRALDLPADSADAAFARWLLCFLAEPQAAIEGMARALKPGGILVVMDYYNYEGFANQPGGNAHFQRVFRAVYESFGVGLDVGGHVPRMMAACGLEVIETKEISGVARPGNRIWNWVAEFQRIYLPELVKRGLLQEDERQAHLNEWREREQDPQACLIAPAMVGVIGAKF